MYQQMVYMKKMSQEYLKQYPMPWTKPMLSMPIHEQFVTIPKNDATSPKWSSNSQPPIHNHSIQNNVENKKGIRLLLIIILWRRRIGGEGINISGVIRGSIGIIIRSIGIIRTIGIIRRTIGTIRESIPIRITIRIRITIPIRRTIPINMIIEISMTIRISMIIEIRKIEEDNL